MWPRDPYARLLGDSPEPPGGGVPVHAGAAAVEQDRAGVPGAGCAIDGPSDRWWQRDQDHLGALAADSQHPVTVFLAKVTDVRTGGFEDPQAQPAEHGHQGEVIPVSGCRPDRQRTADLTLPPAWKGSGHTKRSGVDARGQMPVY
jgi:hypothetical protein